MHTLVCLYVYLEQVAKLAEAVPDNIRAYTYTLLSLGGGIVLGLAIYGWSVWVG